MAHTHARRQQLDIKQEHRIFSAYVKASFPENTNGIASSLVWGDDLIHVYTFTLWDRDWPMIAHTYSRYGEACFHSSWEGASNVVRAMGHHLNVCTPE